MRKPRFEMDGFPLHVTQRGVDRGEVFRDDRDRFGYLNSLEVCSARQQVAVHGYVLMSNHVHLLASSPTPGAVSRMMQGVLAAYVPRFNSRWTRTGPLWEGRFRSCVVDSERYLLNCLAYIELNPVRAGLCSRVDGYPWSSVRHHLGQWTDPRVSSHRLFVSLGKDVASRGAAWREILSFVSHRSVTAEIRDQLHHSPALGSPDFRAEVESRLGYRRRPQR